MAISLIPMRLGEVVRPFLISTKEEVPLTSALATVLVERVLDAIALVVGLFVVLLFLPLPDWVITGGIIILALGILVMTVIVLSAFNKATSLVTPLFRLVPSRLNTRLRDILKTFADGFKVASDPGKMGYVLLLTFLIWGTSAAGVYILFIACDHY